MSSLNQYMRHFDHLDGITEENKEAVRWFLDECAAEGLTDARQKKYIFGFKTLLTQFMEAGQTLPALEEPDLKRIVAQIHRSDYSESTKCFLKQCLKKFFKFQNGGEYPKKVSFFRTTEKAETTVKREDLFTPEELRLAMSKMRNIRDRAYIITQYEAAARTGEILNATLSDVRFDAQGDFVRLYGVKNMPSREIQLVDAGYYLKEWIRMHPSGGDPFNPQDPQAPLWVKLEQFSCRHCGVSSTWHEPKGCSQYEPRAVEPMSLYNIQKNFRIACQKAGIKKRSYRLYNLRHTRITEASKFMSHEQLCKFAGWKPGSGQFHVYVHLTSEDVNQAIRDQYQLGQQQTQEPVTCKVCWQQNEPKASECRNCRRPLSLKSAAQGTEGTDVQEALSVLAELQEQGKLDQLMAVAKQLRTA